MQGEWKGLCSELSVEEVADHADSSQAGRVVERREVEGRRETVGESEGKHGRDPTLSELKSPSTLVELCGKKGEVSGRAR